jgi:GT2 family glycosyltransferase
MMWASLKAGEWSSPARYFTSYCYYLLRGRYRDAHLLARIRGSAFFDSGWYLERNGDVADAGYDPAMHYFDFGAAEKRDPSEMFDTRYYVESNADAQSGRLNPLLHFLRQNPDPSLQSWRRRRKLRPQEAVGPKHARKPRPASRYKADSRSSTPRARYVVYTAVIGGYDELKPIAYIPPNCDLVAFSDHPLEVAGWKVLPLNYLNRDPVRASRFVKLHPHLYFPEYTHSIWMDANIGVRGDIGAFFDSLPDHASVSAFKHPLRDCVYDEGAECIARRKDEEDIIARHLQRYKDKGVPESIGLWETNLLVRRHNDPACIELMGKWWQEIQIGSRRDQLSLPVVQRELGTAIAELDTPGVCARRHPLLTLGAHRRKKPGADLDVTWPKGVSSEKSDQSSMTIGICVHNGLEVVKRCLASVAAARQTEDSIVIVDDASDLPTASFLDKFAATHRGVRLLRNTDNLGYTKSANRIFKAATTDWVVLLNSDTVVPRAAFRKLVEAGEQCPRLAIVGPVSNAAGWQTVPRMTGEDGTFLVNQLRPQMTPDLMDELCEEAAPTTVMFVPLVNGFCIAVRRKVLDQIGYFDEQRFPLGYGEEDDLCLRVADAGYVCGLASNTYVYHVKSASFTSARRKLLSADGQVALKAKYGVERLTAVTEYMRKHPGLRNLRVKLRSLERLKSRLLVATRSRSENIVGHAAHREVAFLSPRPGALSSGRFAGPHGRPMV